MSRAKTPEEVQEEFLQAVMAKAHYWSVQEGITDGERCNGVAFSILALIDGCSCLPAFDLVPSPHPSDKQFAIDNGDDWYEPEVINSYTHLHEEYHQKELKELNK